MWICLFCNCGIAELRYALYQGLEAGWKEERYLLSLPAAESSHRSIIAGEVLSLFYRPCGHASAGCKERGTTQIVSRYSTLLFQQQEWNFLGWLLYLRAYSEVSLLLIFLFILQISHHLQRCRKILAERYGTMLRLQIRWMSAVLSGRFPLCITRKPWREWVFSL